MNEHGSRARRNSRATGANVTTAGRKTGQIAELRRNEDSRIERMLLSAGERCRRRGARLTAQRTAIFTLLLQRPHPRTAYELRAEFGRLQHRAVSPITIYRALAFLMQQGLVAHLARRGAYVACEHVERDHVHLVFVCTACGATTERADRTTERRVAHAASAIGFVPEPMTIEIDGLCKDCQRVVANTAWASFEAPIVPS